MSNRLSSESAGKLSEIIKILGIKLSPQKASKGSKEA
jgi:hypothetical protein